MFPSQSLSPCLLPANIGVPDDVLETDLKYEQLSFLEFWKKTQAMLKGLDKHSQKGQLQAKVLAYKMWTKAWPDRIVSQHFPRCLSKDQDKLLPPLYMEGQARWLGAPKNKNLSDSEVGFFC